MKAPDKIYIAETPNKLIEIWSDEPIESKPYITEHEYIRKNALLEWLRKEADKSFNSFAREELGLEARHRGLDFEEVIRKINSL